MGGRRMRAALGLRVDDVPAEAIDWRALAPEIEDLIARYANVDGDQVGLHIYEVFDESDDFADDIDELVLDWGDDPRVVDVAVGAYL